MLVYQVTEPEGDVAAGDRVLADLGTAAGVSDRGLRHTRNEDAMALRQVAADAMVVAVADGVSTSHRPHAASRAAVAVAVDVLAAAVRDRADPVAATRDAIAEAATAVAALHRPDELGIAPACTFVSAVVIGGHITVGWIGDSRAYWLAAPGGTPSQCLTTDDTWAGHAVRAGRETPQEAYGDGRGGPLWRWLGADADGEPAQVATLQTTGSGTVLLCSDGLWNYLWNSEELAALVREAGHPLSAATMLTGVALEAGGRDNITAVVVTVPAVQSCAPGRSAQRAGSSLNELTIRSASGSTALGSEPAWVNTVTP